MTDGDCYAFWVQRLKDNEKVLTPGGAKGVIFKVSKLHLYTNATYEDVTEFSKEGSLFPLAINLI